MCHKYLFWAFEMSMGEKKESYYFSCFSAPKSSSTMSLHLCDSSEKIRLP